MVVCPPFVSVVVVFINNYEGIGLNRFGGTVVGHSPPAALLSCVMVAAAAAAAAVICIALARAKRLMQTHGKARAASQTGRVLPQRLQTNVADERPGRRASAHPQ